MNYQNYDTTIMRNKFFEYIKKLDSNVDYIVISGDLVYQYGDYDVAKSFCESLTKALPKARLICVPGNHDLYRYDKVRITNIKGLQSYDELDIVANIHDAAIQEILLSPFKNYFEFQQSTTYEITQASVQVLNSDKCNFLLINTALTSFEKDESGKLLLDIEEAYRLISECDKSKPIIGVGHHTFDFLHSGISTRLFNLFRDNKIHLYMCGHTHKMDISDYLSNDAKIKQVISGSGMIDGYSTNGFYVIDYKDTSFTLKAYRYKPNNQEWDNDPDILGFQKGSYTFTFSAGHNSNIERAANNQRQISERCKAYLVLIATYPQFGNFQYISEELYPELIENELVIDAEGACDYIIQISEIGNSIRNHIPVVVQETLCIELLKEFATSELDGNVSVLLCDEYIKSGDFSSAKDLFVEYGRIWLETQGLSECINLLDRMGNIEDNSKLMYFYGLAELFRGRFTIAQSYFQKLKVNNAGENIINLCFQFEIAECDRRQSRFDSCISLLNRIESMSLDESYWSGVIYELMGHLTRQFFLSTKSVDFYQKAVTIFRALKTKESDIEHWHCVYALNQLENLQKLKSSGISGGFLKGLYALTNAKYYAKSGNNELAIKYVNESISAFKSFQSDSYLRKGCILKLLIFLSLENNSNVEHAIRKLNQEEKAQVNIEEKLIQFMSSRRKSEIIESYFGQGQATKAVALMALEKKYYEQSSNKTIYDSLVIEIIDSLYCMTKKSIDYADKITESKLAVAILDYI